MSINELFADSLHRNLDLLKRTLSDMTDADLLVRPAPGANHAAWQIGHVIGSEAWMVNSIKPGAVTALAPNFGEKFRKDTASIDDPSFFPKKSELLDTFENVRAATIEWVKGLSPADMNSPSPEQLQRIGPTVGHTVMLIPTHLMMHLGQIQVIRRTLGKPVLF